MGIPLGAALLAVSLNFNPRVHTIEIPISPGSDQHIALHCESPAGRSDKGVLFIHGSSFPTMLAAGYEFKSGDSWIDFMAAHGFYSCGLDFLGFGASSRPEALSETPTGKPPLLRAPEAAREIVTAITYLRGRDGIGEVHIIAHSWGTIPAAEFAATHPGSVASLTLFGPVIPHPGSKPETEHVAWWSTTAKERLRALYFRDVLPAGVVLLAPALAKNWAEELEASAPHFAGDPPGVIRIPNGPNADIDAAHDGIYPYEPGWVTAPVFVVYGDYDVEANHPNVSAFLARFTSSRLKWQLCIHDGTHVMHLERNRMSLYESVLGFIRTTERMTK